MLGIGRTAVGSIGSKLIGFRHRHDYGIGGVVIPEADFFTDLIGIHDQKEVPVIQNIHWADQSAAFIPHKGTENIRFIVRSRTPHGNQCGDGHIHLIVTDRDRPVRNRLRIDWGHEFVVPVNLITVQFSQIITETNVFELRAQLNDLIGDIAYHRRMVFGQYRKISGVRIKQGAVRVIRGREGQGFSAHPFGIEGHNGDHIIKINGHIQITVTGHCPENAVIIQFDEIIIQIKG